MSLNRAYTDATFSELSPVPPEWQHLGLLGPVLHAEEGDTIVTVVRNAAQFEFTFNLDGAVLSDNSTFIESEFPGQVVASRVVQPGGANATTPRGNVGGGPEAIQPNTTAVSVWKITSESAPGAMCSSFCSIVHPSVSCCLKADEKSVGCSLSKSDYKRY